MHLLTILGHDRPSVIPDIKMKENMIVYLMSSVLSSYLILLISRALRSYPSCKHWVYLSIFPLFSGFPWTLFCQDLPLICSLFLIILAADLEVMVKPRSTMSCTELQTKRLWLTQFSLHLVCDLPEHKSYCNVSSTSSSASFYSWDFVYLYCCSQYTSQN